MQSLRAEALKCSADISKDKDKFSILSKKVKPPFYCLWDHSRQMFLLCYNMCRTKVAMTQTSVTGRSLCLYNFSRIPTCSRSLKWLQQAAQQGKSNGIKKPKRVTAHKQHRRECNYSCLHTFCIMKLCHLNFRNLISKNNSSLSVKLKTLIFY